MNINNPNKQTYYRLVSLWVLCEALLGGIIHGLKLPVSGLVVGSSAVICICLIGYYHPVRGAILKATIIVAIFKMTLSPQSPLPAYIAVFFQGLVGEAIFLNRKSYKLNCVLLATIALFESGVQRIIMMTIISGMDIWMAIDDFINDITKEKTVTRYSYYLAGGYVFLHIIAGFIVGVYAGKIPGKAIKNEDKYLIPDESDFQNETIIKKKKRGRGLLIVWILLFALFILWLFPHENHLLPPNKILRLIIRSVFVILTWVVVINPIVTALLHKWLEKKKNVFGNEIREITTILPSMRFLIRRSWDMSSEKKGFSRIFLFFNIVFLNSLRHE